MSKFEHGANSRVFHDVFTRSEDATALAESLRPYFRARKGTVVKLLEPAVGSGNLLSPIMDVAEQEGVTLEITVCEIQLDYADYFEQKARERGCTVVRQASEPDVHEQ